MIKNATTHIYIGLLSLIFVTIFITAPSYAKDKLKLEVVYPQNNAKISASSTFFVGNTEPGATLLINSQNVKVYPNGAFVKVVPLKQGVNKISLVSAFNGVEKRLEYTINTPEGETILPNTPLGIDTTTIQPGENMVFSLGETLNVSFKGATGNKAYFSIGNRRNNVPMQEVQPPKGIYKGIYTFGAEDDFKNEPLILTLVSDKDKFQFKARGTISTIMPEELPIIAKVIKENVIVRDFKTKNRLTPLPEGTFISLIGKRGSDFKYKAGSIVGLISENDVFVLPPGSAIEEIFPSGKVENIDIISEPDKVLLKIPMSARLPIYIEQPAEADMSLKILGAKATGNLISTPAADKFLKEIKWAQTADNTVQINMKTAEKHFWGYNYYYEDDNTLVLELKKPPKIDANKPLKGITICIDPGHGGKEKGSVGPTGVPEKDINLGISLALRDKLVSKGANVILTRADDRDTEIYSRVDYAVDNNAVILLSIHNNALPDGKDPYKDHGTASYYYHPQSLPLTKVLQEAMLEDLKFNDHGIYRESFVLTRPPQLLAVLLEVGFMIHPDEYALLTQPEFQTKAANSIARGLEFFLFKTAIGNVEPAKSAASNTGKMQVKK